MSDKVAEMASRIVYSEEDLAKRKTPAQVIRENSDDDTYIDTTDEVVKGIAFNMKELDDMTISEEAVAKVVDYFVSHIDETIFSGEGVIYIDGFGTFHACKDTGGTAFTRYFMQVQPSAIVDPQKETDAKTDLLELIRTRNENW